MWSLCLYTDIHVLTYFIYLCYLFVSLSSLCGYQMAHVPKCHGEISISLSTIFASSITKYSVVLPSSFSLRCLIARLFAVFPHGSLHHFGLYIKLNIYSKENEVINYA